MSAACIGPMRCDCCGEEESRSGCVRGYRCGCLHATRCLLCKKCDEHHHRNCTPELREKAQGIELSGMLALQSLRDANRINIFERGEVKEEFRGSAALRRRLNLE